MELRHIITVCLGAAICGGFIVGRSVFRLFSRSNVTKHFENYIHHGSKPVWVRSDLKGEHRDFCLCFDCKRFHPGSETNCRIANAVYKTCIEYNLVTPMWECPKFLQDPTAVEGWSVPPGRDTLIS